MACFINFKICDNAPECSGIEVCPVKAITYNEEKKTIEIDNEKCISCGLCEKACPIGAFRVAKTKEEAKKIEQEFESDSRTIKDLFVDRYGAAPLSEFFMINSSDIEEKTEDKDLVLIECYSDDSIECLLKSIPIKELTKDLPKTTLFFKANGELENFKNFNIKELPSLLIFNKGNLLGKIEGYFEEKDKENLIKEINKLINK